MDEINFKKRIHSSLSIRILGLHKCGRFSLSLSQHLRKLFRRGMKMNVSYGCERLTADWNEEHSIHRFDDNNLRTLNYNA